MSGNIKLNTPSNGSVTISTPDTASAVTVTIPAATDTATLNTQAQTLTNKTLTAAGANSIEATSGPTSTQLAGNRNKIINGAMQVWQRGTSFTTTTLGWNYTADRFASYCANTSTTVSQSTSVPAGFQYSIKQQRTAANAGTNTLYLAQAIESVNCYDLSGQTVTLSFWAKAGANFSASGSQITAAFAVGTTADQGLAVLGGWAGQTLPIFIAQTITTTWTKYTFSATVGTGVLEAAFYVQWTPVGTAGADDSLYITGVQLEKGATATPFENRLYGTELALCQRYYQTISGATLYAYVIDPGGSSAYRIITGIWPVQFRVTPSMSVTTSGTAVVAPSVINATATAWEVQWNGVAPGSFYDLTGYSTSAEL